MQILSINNFSYNQKFQTQQNFLGQGKPITLQYIVQKRADILPPVILEKAKEALASYAQKSKTLMEIHLERYLPLKNCKTMDEVKKLYPEFANIKETVEFKRESVYTRTFREKAGDNFVLNTLKAYWSDLKTLDEIAQDLGMAQHSSMQRALEHVNFVTYPHNYKTILFSSDPKGNEIIAQKTTAWNAMHPDLMLAKNKHAAQGCKKESYRKAKSKSMKEFYNNHPERREKMSESLREDWQKCPDIRQAMSEFLSKESSYIRNLISKKRRGAKLNDTEDKLAKSFYKKFWDAHPELKKIFSETRKGSKVT